MSFFTPSLPHALLDKMLRMLLSTTFDGERENAARAIARVLDKHRMPILVAALDCATTRGWTIFPAPWLRSKKGLKRGLKSAQYSDGRPWGSTRDVVEITTDWLRWPHANLGVVCGPKSGIWVTEIDIKPNEGIDGGAALAWLEELNGKLPDTLMAITPSGSIHRYFNWPRDGRDIRNSASRVGRGIDIRGQGGMVIAPPSMRNGRRYRWINEGTPIADAPEWLIAAARAASSGMPRSGGTSTPDPEEAFDADGKRQDGREAFMRNVVWREVRKWYREVGGALPPKGEWQGRCASAYEDYEAAVIARIDGLDKRSGLEREGRGPTVFWDKWQYAMRKWGAPAMAAEQRHPGPEYNDDQLAEWCGAHDDDDREIAADDGVDSALDLWANGKEDLSGTPAERYLRGGAPIAALRFHPEFPHPSGATIPALLALISNAHTDEPQGIYVVALGEATGCWTLGDRNYGAIKLVPPPFNDVGRELTIGADLETTINMLRLGSTPAWVALEPNLFPVLHGVEELTIIGGNATTAARWRAAGRLVRVI